MMKTLRSFRLWPAISWIIFLSPSLSAQMGDIQVGRPFPELSLPLMDGAGSASIASFRGSKLVLHVWASW